MVGGVLILVILACLLCCSAATLTSTARLYDGKKDLQGDSKETPVTKDWGDVGDEEAQN